MSHHDDAGGDSEMADNYNRAMASADRDFLKRLHYLSLLASRTGGGPLLAAPRRKLPAGGTEVTATRDYAPGDNYRQIDWVWAAQQRIAHQGVRGPNRPAQLSAAGLFGQHGGGPAHKIRPRPPHRRRTRILSLGRRFAWAWRALPTGWWPSRRGCVTRRAGRGCCDSSNRSRSSPARPIWPGRPAVSPTAISGTARW